MAQRVMADAQTPRRDQLRRAAAGPRTSSTAVRAGRSEAAPASKTRWAHQAAQRTRSVPASRSTVPANSSSSPRRTTIPV